MSHTAALYPSSCALRYHQPPACIPPFFYKPEHCRRQHSSLGQNCRVLQTRYQISESFLFPKRAAPSCSGSAPPPGSSWLRHRFSAQTLDLKPPNLSFITLAVLGLLSGGLGGLFLDHLLLKVLYWTSICIQKGMEQ